MMPILETVPNFSEGKDLGFLREVSAEMRGAGVDILDASADPDHHRSVVSAVGTPAEVEDALVAAARVAREWIDLRDHRGIHPRIGALDVAPVVPLLGADISTATSTAHRVADRIAQLGIPVYLYGRAGPDGRTLADLRRGGFEQLADGFPAERPPDRAAGRSSAHPSAGVSCVGARPLLLAWNLFVEGVAPDELRRIASSLRETGGGFEGLRVLALSLPARGEHQLSMNLEDVERRNPDAVFEAADRAVTSAGGHVVATEVIGMIPDALVLRTSAHRLRLLGADAGRLLSARVARHVARRGLSEFETLVTWIRAAGSGVPSDVRAAAERLALQSTTTPILGDSV